MSEGNVAKLVIIDDEELVRSMLAKQLGKLGYKVRTAGDGPAGLELVRNERPDLVLSDLRMPNMDGLKVMQELRMLYPDLPVIVMSGAGLLDDAIGALKLGAWDYVGKPVESAVLDHAISKTLEKARLMAENRRYQERLEAVNRDLGASLRLLAEDADAGRQIQSRMLPRNHQHFGTFEFSRELLPSVYLSGDFIDAFAIDNRHWGFYLADVSGHGISSALVTVLLRTFVQRQVSNYSRIGDSLVLSPARMLARLNEQIVSENLDKHLTMFFAVVDLETDDLVYSNAGHFPWPMLVCGGRPVSLEQPGMPIGIMPHTQYTEHRVSLPPEMTLAVFSDGVLEVLPQQNVDAKLAYLHELIARANVTIEQIRETLGLGQHGPLPDDIALLLVKRGTNEHPAGGPVRPD